MTGALGRLVRRVVDVRDGEIAAVVWSCAYFFFVLSSYYVLRPIRDEMGVAGGVRNLAWLFSATLLGMLLLHPVYTALVARLPRRRFVPLVYRFFIANLVIFFLLFRAADTAQAVWIGRVFFIWTSVFNLFVVSVFWSLMADLYRPSQSQRLFGLVAVGGTLGSVLGASITSGLSQVLSPASLLLVSALLLEIAARSARALDGEEQPLARAAGDEEPARPSPPVIGGGVLDGVRDVARSPYLLGIAMLMLLFTITSTFLYFQQADIVARAFATDPQARTRLFANIDLAVNVLTLVTQVFLTGRVLRWLGVGLGLAFLPLLTLVGAAILAAAPVLAVLVVFQVLRRAGNFAIQRPAREVLYTVLPRTEKYKAKNLNDTFVYRLGDQLGAWSYTAIAWVGFGLSGLALTMIPLSAVWLLLALWLGARHRRLRGYDARMRSAIAIALGVVIALSAAGVGHAQPSRAGRELKIAILLGPSGRGDKSFTDAALAGLDAAKKRGPLAVVERLPVRPEDYDTAIDALAADEPDLIIGVGFLYAEPFRTASARHPRTRFLLLDAELPNLPNVKSVTFRADEGSFLAGAAAAAESKRGVVGFVGGMSMPIIQAFECGFESGVRFAAKELGRPVKGYAIYIGTTPEAFSSPAEGAEIARGLITKQGVDVLFAAAGASGLGVIEAAREAKVKAIGVDIDQGHIAPGIVITSMRKRLDRAVETAIVELRRGSFRGGPSVMTLAHGGVDLVLPGRLAPATVKLAEKARAAIVSGRRAACGEPRQPAWRPRR